MISVVALPVQGSDFYLWVGCGFFVHLVLVQFWAKIGRLENGPNPHSAHTKPIPNPHHGRRHAHNKPTPNPDRVRTGPRRCAERKGTKPTPRAHRTHNRPTTQNIARSHKATPNPQRSKRHVRTVAHTKPRPNPESVDSMRGTRTRTAPRTGTTPSPQ